MWGRSEDSKVRQAAEGAWGRKGSGCLQQQNTFLWLARASLLLRHNSLAPGNILGGWFVGAPSPQKTTSPTPEPTEFRFPRIANTVNSLSTCIW